METDVADLIRIRVPMSATIDASDHEQIAALLALLHSEDYKGCRASTLAMLPALCYSVRYYLEGGEEFRRLSTPDATCYEAALVHRNVAYVHNLSVASDTPTSESHLTDYIVESIKHLFVIAQLYDLDVLDALQESLDKSAKTYIARVSSQPQDAKPLVKKPTV